MHSLMSLSKILQFCVQTYILYFPFFLLSMSQSRQVLLTFPSSNWSSLQLCLIFCQIHLLRVFFFMVFSSSRFSMVSTVILPKSWFYADINHMSPDFLQCINHRYSKSMPDLSNIRISCRSFSFSPLIMAMRYVRYGVVYCCIV